MWIKLNITSSNKKIEIYGSFEKINHTHQKKKKKHTHRREFIPTSGIKIHNGVRKGIKVINIFFAAEAGHVIFTRTHWSTSGFVENKIVIIW